MECDFSPTQPKNPGSEISENAFKFRVRLHVFSWAPNRQFWSKRRQSIKFRPFSRTELVACSLVLEGSFRAPRRWHRSAKLPSKLRNQCEILRESHVRGSSPSDDDCFSVGIKSEIRAAGFLDPDSCSIDAAETAGSCKTWN